jgi:hypothetical protein
MKNLLAAVALLLACSCGKGSAGLFEEGTREVRVVDAGVVVEPPDSGQPLKGLVYVDPPTGGKLALVRGAGADEEVIRLDLVAREELTAYSVGFNLPLDATRVKLRDFIPGTALPPGALPAAAGALIPGQGPLAGVLVVAQTQKANASGAVLNDSKIGKGQVLLSVRLERVAGAAPGLVFDGATPGPKFRGLLRSKLGTDVIKSQELVIGRLELR